MIQKILFLVFILISIKTTAQQELMDNKNISYVGEFFFDSSLSPFPFKGQVYNSYSLEIGKIKPLRNDIENLRLSGLEPFGSAKIIQWVDQYSQGYNPEIKTYQDYNLSKEEVVPNIRKIDTLDNNRIVASNYFGEQIKGIRVYCLLYFDVNKNQLLIEPKSLSPLVVSKKNKTSKDSINYTPLFWLPIYELQGDEKSYWGSNSVTYICQTNNNIDKTEIDLLKGTFDYETFFPSQLLDKNVIIHNNYLEKINNFEERKELIAVASNTVDTIITFDPDTYEEKVTIQKVGGYDYTGLRIVVRWFFDEKQNRVYAKLIACAPELKYENDSFSRAQYYYRYKE